MTRQLEIFCPKCGKRPNPLSMWSCEPACGCRWHTFDTHGVCPDCGKHWEETQCLNCGEWSPHADWYHEGTTARDLEEIALPA